MRLTLRTLLAYLDDTLDPAEAKRIGQKVAESETARELIERIKQVTRRRRLTVPPNTGPGSKVDANTISEYLDNTLPGDQLAEVEEVCLGSDVHLAEEMAACHQILALVVGEPVLVPPVARQRMYGLVKGREAIPYRKAPVQKSSRQAPRVRTSGADETDEALLLGLPLYNQTGTAARWLVPIGALLLLILAGVAFFKALPSTSVRPAPGETVASTTIPPKAAEEKPVPEAKKAPEPEKQQEPAAEPEKKADQPEEKKPAAEPEKKAEVATDKKPDPDEKKSETPSAPAAPGERKELGRYVAQAMAPPTVLLQRSSTKEPWQRLRPGSPVLSDTELMSLPGYRSELRLDSGVQLFLWGNLTEFSGFPVSESVVSLSATPGLDLDFRLDHGQVVFSNRKSEGPVRVRVRFLEQTWELTLQNSSTEVSLALFGVTSPYSREGKMEPIYFRVALVTLAGETFLKTGSQEFSLPKLSWFDWDSLGYGVQGPRPISRLPDWWSGTRGSGSKESRNVTTALEELSKRLRENSVVERVLVEGLSDPDEASRTLAVRCLMAVGDVSRVVDALDDAKHLDTRLYAIQALRHWLGLSSENDKLLLTTLVQQKQYTQSQAETLVQLIHGFYEKDWADPSMRASIVEYLNHDRLPIRQLAHWLLTSAVREGRKIRYDPAGDTALKQSGYEQWRKLIGGDSRPAPKPPAPGK